VAVFLSSYSILGQSLGFCYPPIGKRLAFIVHSHCGENRRNGSLWHRAPYIRLKHCLSTGVLESVCEGVKLSGLPSAAISAQTGKHNVADGSLKGTLGLSQGIIQASAFFQLSLIDRVVAQEGTGSVTARGAKDIKFVGGLGRSANRKGSVTFG
jgi:hypothetical protein